jgi:signal transduction histidine kinase
MALEKAKLYAQRERMEENLHFYLQQITRAQEEERKRIARELHDDTIQALVIHSRRLDELASDESMPVEKMRVRLEDLLEDTNEIVHGVRRMSRDLRPATLDRLGLLPALERLAADASQEGQLAVEVRTTGRERRLTDEAAIALFRIAQEALNNVRRHAQASRVDIMVEYMDSRLRLTVSDDGKGFARNAPLSALPRHGKLGLAGMEERAHLLGGEATIESELGKGTRVTVEVPV